MERNDINSLFEMFEGIEDCVALADDAVVVNSNSAFDSFFACDSEGVGLEMLFGHTAAAAFLRKEEQEKTELLINDTLCEATTKRIDRFLLIRFRPIEKNRRRVELSHVNLANEARGPLSIIFNSLELLSSKVEREPGSRLDDYIAHINRSVYQLLKLTNNLVDSMSYIEDELKCEKSNGNIIKAIEDVCRSLDSIGGLDIRFEKAVLSHIIAFDSLQIERAVYNVISGFLAHSTENKYPLEQVVSVSATPEYVFISFKNSASELGGEFASSIMGDYKRFCDNEQIDNISTQFTFIILEMHNAILRQTEKGVLEICIPNQTIDDGLVRSVRSLESLSGMSQAYIEMSGVLSFRHYRKKTINGLNYVRPLLSKKEQG